MKIGKGLSDRAAMTHYYFIGDGLILTFIGYADAALHIKDCGKDASNGET